MVQLSWKCSELPINGPLDVCSNPGPACVGPLVSSKATSTLHFLDILISYSSAKIHNVQCKDNSLYVILNYMFFLISDNRCPAPKQPAYSKPTTIIASATSQVTFTCMSGYTYPDKTVTKKITCKTNLQWDATTPDCERKFLLRPLQINLWMTDFFVPKM
jgi:hypothetical protein